MATARKFLFDVSFDEAEPDPVAASETDFVRADIAAARAAGYAEGREAALKEAADFTEARTAAALNAIERGLAGIIESRAASVAAAEKAAVELIRTALQKVVPALCRKGPLAELEALIGDCLGECLDEPRLVLRVGDQIFDAVEARIAPLTRAAGYGGKVVLLADAALGPGDGRIEWADGGAERDAGRFLRELDALLARIVPEETA
jgi:flagellar assembly protein FliH